MVPTQRLIIRPKKDKLFQHEVDRLIGEPDVEDTSFECRLPRSYLSDGGIKREDNFILDLQEGEWTGPAGPAYVGYFVERVQSNVLGQSSTSVLPDGILQSRTWWLLCTFRLIETLVDPARRNMQPGLFTRVWDAIQGHLNLDDKHEPRKNARRKMRGDNGVNYFIPTLRMALHHTISKSLLRLQCWMDYQEFNRYLTQRVQMKDRDRVAIEQRLEEVGKVV